MAEPIIPPMTRAANRFREAAGIQAARIFDSCSDKDCLEDLQVFFPAQDQKVVNSCLSICAKSAEITDVDCKVEPQSFQRGYYTVDMTYHFSVRFTATIPAGAPVEVSGYAYHQKGVVLFGGEAGVKTFTSAGRVNPPTAEPVAVVQVPDPVALGAILTERVPAYCEDPDNVPLHVAAHFAAIGLSQPGDIKKSVAVTLGIFSVVSLVRETALLMPVYDYAIPEKNCSSTHTDPCETFQRIRFPSERFYPDGVNIRR